MLMASTHTNPMMMSEGKNTQGVTPHEFRLGE
jgi:hypothetical protein